MYRSYGGTGEQDCDRAAVEKVGGGNLTAATKLNMMKLCLKPTGSSPEFFAAWGTS